MTTILVTLDGARPDGIQQANTPTLDKLIAGGASTMTAQAVMPSMTLPCHMSIFHSVPPERHGMMDNTYHPMARPLPGLFEQIRNNYKTSASFYAWEPLRDLSRPLMVSYSFHRETDYTNLEHSDHKIVENALPIIETNAYDFVFLYIGATDEIGHRDGWMSDGYLRQIEIADGLLGTVVDCLPDGSHLLVEADHGGHDRNHGTNLPEDMTIPWIIWGEKIKRNHIIEQAVTLLDTAPTLAHILGVPPAQQWEGRVVAEAFAD
jgi:predicted AlkP superfamily pyrophosphatase or phosphodiesterase